MFEELISAGIVSVVVITLFITLPGEAPLKRLLSRHAVSKMFYYYTTFYLLFAVILIFWTISNWGWKSMSFQSYAIIRKLESRITKLLLLIILCVPCRYILRLMIIPSSASKRHHTESSKDSLESIEETEEINSHKRYESAPLINKNLKKKDLKKLIFGPKPKKKELASTDTPFQELESVSALYTASKWEPVAPELFEIAGLFQLFAKVRVHGQRNIPRNKPCLIVVNHALGHGFDVPMMVYILRKICHLTHVRVLVSPKHFNYPIWCDMVYYLGGVPRTHQITEHLMKNGENIIMFAAKKKKTSMIWDNRRHLFLDLVHKYDYMLVPAVCVSDDDVINMVYNIDDASKETKNYNSKKRRKKFNIYNKIMNVNEEDTDCTDTDNDDEEKGVLFRSVRTIHGRLRRGYRKQYHLRFSVLYFILFCFMLYIIYNISR